MLKKVTKIILLLTVVILFLSSIYYTYNYPKNDIDSVLFTMKYGLSESDLTPVYDAIKVLIIPIILLFTFLYLILYKTKLYNLKFIRIIIFIILGIIIPLSNIRIPKFLYNTFVYSKIIDNNYVEPSNVDIEFKKKKNLVYIILESFESTVMDDKNGGMWKYNLMPEVSEISNNYKTNYFYKKNKGGFKMLDAASYTSAALITNHSSMPFKYNLNMKVSNKHFLNKAYTMGDMLKSYGYHNELISAATTNFGGIKTFFTIHGDYDIIDIHSLKDYDLSISNKDKLSWGFNDGYMFDVAKKRIETLSKEDEPFNITMVGIDTHFPKGFKSYYTVDTYDKDLENAYRTESILLSNFLSWLKESEYYKDTTVVIMGDHLSMQKNFFEGISYDDRNIYFCIINSDEKASYNNRLFTSLDTYPTIISSLGGKISGDKIGLGVNLYSSEKTLAEKYGFDKLNKELDKNSKYYNSYMND